MSADPIAMLADDRAKARADDDGMHNLCTIATVDERGEPHARTLVLREVDDRLAVFTNATSPKHAQFAESETICAVVCLPSVSVQYRITAALEPIDPDVVHRNWQLRPQPPKRMDWVYATHPQSSSIGTRSALLEAFAGSSDWSKAPESSVGFFLEPITVDRLDLNQPDGVHDRRLFTNSPGSSWIETVLVP